MPSTATRSGSSSRSPASDRPPPMTTTSGARIALTVVIAPASAATASSQTWCAIGSPCADAVGDLARPDRRGQACALRIAAAHARGAGDRLQAAELAAAAAVAARVHLQMAHLARVAVAGDHPAVRDDRARDAEAQRQEQQAGRAAARAQPPLREGAGADVMAERDREAGARRGGERRAAGRASPGWRSSGRCRSTPPRCPARRRRWRPGLGGSASQAARQPPLRWRRPPRPGRHRGAWVAAPPAVMRHRRVHQRALDARAADVHRDHGDDRCHCALLLPHPHDGAPSRSRAQPACARRDVRSGRAPVPSRSRRPPPEP